MLRFCTTNFPVCGRKLTHAALLYHKLPSLWQETVVFSENVQLTERAAVKIAEVLFLIPFLFINHAEKRFANE